METWKRNLYVVWAAELLSLVGFSVAFPFLPYYIQNLGITDLKQVELWSAVVISAQSVTMMIFAPLWGSLADRYGRKLMIERAMFGGAVILTLMGFVHSVWQLAALRAAQGALTGTVAAAMTLVASSTPRERSGQALGLLQMAIWVGSSVGPLIGGVIADTWGYRPVFWVTGGLLLLAGLIVWRFVHEDFQPPSRDRSKPSDGFWDGLKVVFGTRALVTLFAVRITGQLGSSLIVPVLPLLIQSLVPPTARVASLNGLISGVSAATSAVSAVILGRTSDRRGYRPVLLACVAGAAVLYTPQAFVTGPWQLLFLQGATGLAIGGVLAAVSTSLAHLAPEGHQGAVYGVDASATSAASALAPIIGASAAAVWGLRLPFLLAAGSFALATGLTWALIPGSGQNKQVQRIS
jgi:DHA1 family multidrug resistance protein-like MFS transporter